jgi:hypothetical protein
MHVLSSAEIMSVIALTAVLAWIIATYMAKRQMRKVAHLEARSAANALEPTLQENRELRALVERQEERLRTLETIATDPSERTSREIEALR